MVKTISQNWPEEKLPVLPQPNTKYQEFDSTQPLLLPVTMLLLHQELKFVALEHTTIWKPNALAVINASTDTP